MPVNRSADENKNKRYAEIVRPEIIKDRLLALRKAYNLTLEEMSSITEGLMTRATLNTWETGARVPAIDGLQIISACFGTCIDWISGMSETPYTEESIRTAKQVFFNGQEETVSTNGLIPDNSLNVRIIHLSDYSLETQANIIVLFRYRNTCVRDVRSIKGAKKKKLTEINNKLLTAIQENKPACRIPKSIKVITTNKKTAFLGIMNRKNAVFYYLFL